VFPREGYSLDRAVDNLIRARDGVCKDIALTIAIDISAVVVSASTRRTTALRSNSAQAGGDGASSGGAGSLKVLAEFGG
jgi:hypothetical protein